MLRIVGTAIVLLILAGPLPGHAQTTHSQTTQAQFGHYQPAEQFSETSTATFYLPMRDGVRLAMRIDRPARDGKPAEGKFPVIWHAQMVADASASSTIPAYDLGKFHALARHGYVVVQVARRGFGQSFGARRGYHDRNEAQDAYEITQWLATQPWSDGRIGIYGCSNTGDAAMHAMTMRPPALKAVFAGCFSWHKYDAFRRGGIFAQWGTGPTRTIEEEMKVRPVDDDADKVLLRQAVEEHQRSTPLFDLWQGLPYRDSYSPLVASRFWQEGSVANYRDQMQRSGAALYIMGGWHDELRDQGTIAFLNLPGSRLLLGPWTHCRNDGFALLEEAHRFFDQYVKGIDRGMAGEPRVHYFTINAVPGTEWRSAATWPLPGTRHERSFLTAAGALSPRKPTTSAASANFTVKYDVACPGANTPLTQGPFAQPCHIAGAGRSFTQPPVSQDTEVTGHATADLWIAADARDANIFAYLEDVSPDGNVRVITEGRLKASLRATTAAPWRMPDDIPWHRAFTEDVAPLDPGRPVQLRFDFMPTSYVIKARHRVRVTLTGADARERDRDTGALATRISIYADRDHPSSVTLPIIAR
jgi:uncharacterized protein